MNTDNQSDRELNTTANREVPAPKTNPLETEKISKLLVSFCIPSLASSLVTCLYNIVDQLFIGNKLGTVGNAATGVIFPMITLITAPSRIWRWRLPRERSSSGSLGS